MYKFLDKVEKNWKYVVTITTILGFIGGLFGFGYKILDEINGQNKLLEDTSRLAQKSIIWNRDIPKIERAETCDSYLARGYDSYTKKLCENYILSEVSENVGSTKTNNTESS